MDWKYPEPGYLEIDLVAQCGGTVTGSFINSLVATDVCSGWTEAIPLLAREQSLVVEGLEAISRVFPVPVRGIDSDNDSVFINETLFRYCDVKGIEFTRSRAYRKNDQAWIEQKNGSVIRRFVGHEPYSGSMAGQILAPPIRGDPSVCEPLPAFVPAAGAEQGWRQRKEAVQETGHTRLPELWREGEVRPTHTSRDGRSAPRTWRSRPDPFEGVWCEILEWLQKHPDITASALLDRLMRRYPDRYSRRQLRTLQRRVRQWQRVVARQLVYASAEQSEMAEADQSVIGPVGVN